MASPGRKPAVLACLFILGAMGYVLYLFQDAKDVVDQSINNKLLYAARATASILGDSYHDGLTDRSSKTEAQDWETIMRLTKFNRELGLSFIYTVIKRDGEAYLISSSASDEELENSTYVRFFDHYHDASQALVDSFEREEPTWVDYNDRWGDFRAVFVPYRSSDGTPYVAGAEVSMNDYYALLYWDTVRHAGLSILIFLVLALMVGYYLLRSRFHLAQLKSNEKALTRAKMRAEEADQAKSLFLATMSHEIRTPMNGLIGATELLIEKNPAPHQEELLRIIKDNGQALLCLIGGILDLSKIEAGKMVIERKWFSLQELIDATLNVFRNNLGDKPIELRANVAARVPAIVYADIDRLRQILINLVANAVRFTESGTVSLDVDLIRKHSASFLTFSVADTGVGIPPEQMSQLFRPFAQLNGRGQLNTATQPGKASSHSLPTSGTGLGLSICKGLVEAMGGTIAASCRPEGGSRFTFSIPVQGIDAQPARTTDETDGSAEAPLPPATAYRVLVAEDNAVNQAIAKAMLQKLGYEPQIAADGREAVELYTRLKPDLILMDMHMPNMDGLEAVRWIREQQDSGRCYIVAFTANAMCDDLERFLAQGVDDVLVKPVKLDSLAQVLRRAWQRQQHDQPQAADA